MYLTKIWERYFLLEFCKTFFLFLTCFYGLYVLIDYSSHASSFHHNHVQFQWKVTALYYCCEFIKRLEVLLPFAMLVATIRTLCTLNSHNELIALMSSGVSLKTLMRPFIIMGLLGTVLLYWNTEAFLPTAFRKIKRIEDSRTEKHKHHISGVQHLALEDGTTLIFQSYDSAKNSFFDSYWIRSIDNVYRIKYLFPNSTSTGVPEGRFVEQLQRNSHKELVKTASFDVISFPAMHFNKQTLFETITPPEEESISDLWTAKPANNDSLLSEKEAQVLAALYRKLALPWLCLLAVMAPAPFCLRSTRQLQVFFIYAFGIFGLVGFYLLMSAAMLLGKRQVMPPFWAIFPPFLIFSGAIFARYIRIK